MKALTIAGVLVACTHLLAGSQAVNGPPTEVVLQGDVLSSADGRPLASVHLSLRTTPDRLSPTTLTDSLGRFALTVPAARRYQLIARKAGFAVATASASPETEVEVRLEPRAVLTGFVVDDTGEPVVGAVVMVSGTDGRSTESALTDDRGSYRVFAPSNERCVLSVITTGTVPEVSSTKPGQVAVRPRVHTTYFPGTADASEAMVLVLAPGEVLTVSDLVIATEQSARQPMSALESLPVVINPLPTTEPQPDDDGIVQGRVVDSAGRSLANAQVLLTSERRLSPTHMTRTDASGAFEFRQVPGGTAHVMASKPGYAPDDARPDVKSGQADAATVSLRLTQWASVSGRVIDEFGEPVEGVRVQAMRIRSSGLRRSLIAAGGVEPVTDDRGEYRIHGLDPGTYVLSAVVAEARALDLPGYVRSYSVGPPGSAVLGSLRLVPGQEMPNIDVQLLRAAVHRVAGQVIRPAQAVGSPSLLLWPSQRAGASAGVPLNGRLEPDGRFEFRDVPEGDYVIQAYRGRISATTEGEFGALAVSVRGGEATGLTLRTSIGSSISGVIVIDTLDDSRVPSRAEIELSPTPADPDLAPAANWATAGVTADWTFEIAGVSGPRRLLPTRLPRGWTLKAILANGADVTDELLVFGESSASLTDVEVVLTDRLAELGGRVNDARGLGVSGAHVVMFPTARESWYRGSRFIRDAISLRDGGFAISGMPPGGYHVVVLPATDNDDPDWWRQGDALEALISRASFVTIGEGQRVQVDLRGP